MTFAVMLKTDRTAVICDFAETYGIFDWRALPVETSAALAAGLRENSRIKMKMAGATISTETALLAAAVDRLSILVWSKTKDCEHGRNRPASLLEALTQSGKATKKDTDFEIYDSAEEFEAARARLFFGGEDYGG